MALTPFQQASKIAMEAAVNPFKAPTTLLMGDSGTGKTTSLATYIEAGLKLACLFTDPGGEEVLIDRIIELGLPLENFYFNYCGPATQDVGALEDMATKINTMSYEALGGIKTGINKQDHDQFIHLLGMLADFHDLRTGESLGPIDKLDDSWAFAIDSLSGVNTMAMELTVGLKPNPHQGEWGTMMKAEEKLVNFLVSSLKCFVCVTCHLDKTKDEVAGRMYKSPAMLGQKLSPTVPRIFSDVILTRREGQQFYWDTDDDAATVKARNIPINGKNPPTFVPIVERYRKRIAALKASNLVQIAEEKE